MDDKAKIRKYLRNRIAWHLKESEKLMSAGSFAAARWENGYVEALRRVLDYTDGMRHSGVR